MFTKKPFPKTTELCDSLLRNLVKAIESPLPFEQAKAYEFLNMIYKQRCKIALSWIYETYHDHPSIFVQQLAKKAYEYLKSLR